MIDRRHILNCYKSRDRESLGRYLASLPDAISVQDAMDGPRYRCMRDEIMAYTGCTADQFDAEVDKDIGRHGE